MESMHNISKITFRRFITVFTFTTALLFSANGLAQSTTTWLGGDGSWNDAAMWTNGVPDISGTIDVFVDGNNPTSSNVIEAFGNINRLNVSSGDVLQIGTSGGSLNTLSITDAIDNQGESIARLGGQLDLDDIDIDNTDGLIVVEDDSIISADNRPFGNSTLDVLRVTLTESSGATDITPSSFEVTRGTLASGTVADLAASDDEDVSVRRNTSDVQSVVQVVASGNSVNAFPAGIEITVESAVFARSKVIQEIYAFNFITNSFELVDARPASRFLDRVDTVSLSGDLTRFVTPAAGNMSIMIRFVSPNNRQQFTANIDQGVWTIFE